MNLLIVIYHNWDKLYLLWAIALSFGTACTASDIYSEYLKTVEILSDRFQLSEKDVLLAFDYTEENFYGDVQGFWIYGWTGEHAVTGKFKFLTCSIVSSDIPQKIPLISIPVYVGHSMANEVCRCYSMIEPLVKSIKLVLFDRGFFSKDLILTLLKNIFDKRSGKKFDWSFATNQTEIKLDSFVPIYKCRWRIETGFRIQDEAHIMSKSVHANIRFFYFVYEQVLQLLWVVLYKEEVSFKEFLLGLYEFCKSRNSKSEGS